MGELDRLAARLRALESGVSALGSAPQLAASSIMDGAVDQVVTVQVGVDGLGNPVFEQQLVSRYGVQDDGSNTVAVFDGPKPPRPTAPLVTAGPGTLVVEWTGEFEDRIEPYRDHDYVAVHVSATAGFTPVAATLKASMRAPQGETVSLPVASGSWYVSLVAVSQAQVWSDPAPYTTGAPGSTGADPVWVAEVNSRLTAVEAAAATAYTLADGKTRVHFGATLPTGAAPGDMWVDAGNGNRISKLEPDGVTWTVQPLGTQSIAAGAVSASLLAAEIVLASKIIAGTPSSAHVELDSTGFASYGVDPDGNPTIITRLGTGLTDALAVYDPVTHEVLGGIDSLGKVSGQTADLGDEAGDVLINGIPFESHFGQQPRGLIEYGMRTTDSPTSTTEVGYLEVQCNLEAGRTYRVETSPFYAGLASSGSLVTILRQAVGGAAVTTASQQLASVRVMNAFTTGQVPTCPPLVYMLPIPPSGVSQEYRFLVSHVASSAVNGYITATAGTPFYLMVTDVGPYVEETGIARSGTGGGTGTKKNYVSIWQGTATSTYNGSGTRRSDTTDMVQGYESFNGNQQAITGFTGGVTTSNYSGELGKSIATALTGATLTRVEAYLYFYHWWQGSGGTALLGVSADPPPYPTSGVGSFAYTTASAGWPKPGGRWVRLPVIANPRSVFIGRPPSTSGVYYGRAYGAGAGSRKPLLRLYYTR